MEHNQLSDDAKAYHAVILSRGPLAAALACMGQALPPAEEMQAQVFLQSLQGALNGLPPAEYLKESTAFHPDLKLMAEKSLNVGVLAQGERIALTTPMNWSSYADKSRSIRYKVHAWGILDAMMAYDSLRTDRRMYKPALEHILDWISNFVLEGAYDEFTWYDMAVGHRATKLGYMFRRAVEEGEPVETLTKLVVACQLHMLELSETNRVAMHSNHGLFQMAGLLSLGKNLPLLRASSAASSFAIDAIQTMLTNHFASDGLHMEHSPMYHVFMTNYMSLLLESGYLEESKQLVSMARSAVEAAQWLAMPDGMLLPFGDTPRILASERAHFPIGPAASETLGVRWFKSGGLVVQHERTQKGNPNSYLAFNGSFHSRQHKHADDFNFLLHANGVTILDDPGTFTYQYDDPRRMYVESTRAHSCLEIDGLNSSRYNQDAFGSAIRHVRSVGPLLYIEAKVGRKRLISSELPNNAIVTNDGVPVDVLHARKLIHLPGDFLLVVDDLKASRKHTYSQHFTINNTLKVELLDKVVLKNGDSPIASIVPLTSDLTDVNVALGQQEPRLHGWSSIDGHTLVPSPSVTVNTKGTACVMATLIDMKPSSGTTVYFNEGTGGKYLRLVLKRKRNMHEFVLRTSGDGTSLTFNSGRDSWQETI